MADEIRSGWRALTCRAAPGGAPSALPRGYLAIAAAVSYVAATAAGSTLDPSYSQLAQPVSDLTATGAPTRALLAPAYVLYNLLCLAFAFAFYCASARTKWYRVGLGLLTVNAIAGIMMVTWFPEDLGEKVATWSGAGHLAFAGISSFCVVASSFVHGVAFRASAQWRGLSKFSMATGIAFLVLGPVAAFAVASRSPLAGLAERGPIGLFILWLLVVGETALTHEPSPTTAKQRGRV